jgi:transposase
MGLLQPVTAGDDPHWLRGEASFAHLCGTAPIPASSGRTRRHRLNRGGDRQANHALWRIAPVRMRCHPPTRACSYSGGIQPEPHPGVRLSY